MVTVGIDPHKHVHVAVAVDADGRRISRPLTVKNDAALIGVLIHYHVQLHLGLSPPWGQDTRGRA